MASNVRARRSGRRAQSYSSQLNSVIIPAIYSGALYTIIDPISDLDDWTLTMNDANVTSGIVSGKLNFESTGAHTSNEDWQYDPNSYAGAFDVVIAYSGLVMATAGGNFLAADNIVLTNAGGNAQILLGRSTHNNVVGGFTNGDGFRAWTYDGASNVELFFVANSDASGYFRMKGNADRSSVQLYTSDGSVWVERYSGNQSAIFNTQTLKVKLRMGSASADIGDIVNFYDFGEVV